MDRVEKKMYWAPLFAVLILSRLAASETGHQYTVLLGIQLAHSKIGDVARSFGATKAVISGDASEYSKRLNYYFAIEKTYVTFDVCEIGGDSTITLIHLSNKSPQEEFRKVTGAKFSKEDMGGLRIGMSKGGFCETLSLTRTCEGDSIANHFTDSIPMTPAEIEKRRIEPGQRAMWDVDIGVIGKFKDQKLSELYLSKVIAY